MLSFFDPLRGLKFIPLLVKLLLSILCGAAIGLERSSKNRPAGFRTHILVCLSGAVAAVTGHYLYLVMKLPADITRLSGQVITGLGFIGAGAIIVTKKMTVKGLTTAAGLWVTGIIGLALGSGFFEGALLGTILVLGVETVFYNIGKNIRKGEVLTLEILYEEKGSLDQVMRLCKDQHMAILNLRIHSENEEGTAYTAVIRLHSFKNTELIIDKIRLMPGIASVEII